MKLRPALSWPCAACSSDGDCAPVTDTWCDTGSCADKKALGAVRKKLKANRLKTPLFDTDLFARHLEAAYGTVWQKHSDGLPPAPVKVPAEVEEG